MGVEIKHRGSFNNLEKFLKEYNREKLMNILRQLGQTGVDALADSTPVATGVTAESWSYEPYSDANKFGIQWYNYSNDNGRPVVILIQYGHATKSGGFVEGRDFINPAMAPVFDKIAETLWEEVTKL